MEENGRDENSEYMQENPTKRHRFREDSSLAWYKAYRCTDIDDYIRKPDSLVDSRSIEHLKNGVMETEMIGDFQFEREKELISSGEEGDKYTRGTKRSKWLHLLDSASLDNSVLNPETPLTEDESSLKASLEADSTTATSEEFDSSSTDLEGSESEEVFQDSGIFIRKRGNTDYLKTGDSGFDNQIEPLSYFKTPLFDVDLSAEVSYRPENVPFVCLTSKFNGKAIMGYPLEVGVITESSKTRNVSVEEKPFDRLVWKTARRTPVCYIKNSLSSLIASENGGPVKEQSLMKLVKNTKQPKQGKTEVGRNCVSVEAIFSKILAAVGPVQS